MEVAGFDLDPSAVAAIFAAGGVMAQMRLEVRAVRRRLDQVESEVRALRAALYAAFRWRGGDGSDGESETVEEDGSVRRKPRRS